jgi:DMSO reductase family type II enzyme molybdopterin subunit
MDGRAGSTHRISRRSFLVGTGALGLSLVLLRPRCGSQAPPAPEPGPSPVPSRYWDWRDLYREHFSWDHIAKGTHHVNCWYQRGCNWNVYVKGGVVIREEQAATYEQTHPGVPDFNPRGCQKGACYSERMYDASRLRHPLRRVGRRGDGRWKRISWEEGLREVADRTIDVLREQGPGAIIWDPGTANANGCNGIGAHRTGMVLDTPLLNVNCEVGDHHPGAMATFGKVSFANSGDDLFYSDLILIWGGNPSYTQIPNAHFINEARYHGAWVVGIAPDYNASAMHTDQWIPVDVGSDAALGLGMAHTILEEEIYDAAFIREQTDLPLLVRMDDRRFLRRQDVVAGGEEDRFYVFDETGGEIREVDPKTLALGELRPALDGEYQVETRDGTVSVRPVFSLLREQLRAYAPEQAAAMTGVRAEQIREFARRVARAKAATIITNSNFSKFYHGLEMERVQILVLTLCGQIGRRGAGMNGFPAMTIAGAASSIVSSGSLSPRAGALLLAAKMAPAFLQHKLAGLTDEMIVYEFTREDYRTGGHISAMLFHHLSAGLDELYGSANQWDPHLKRPFAAYLDEAVAKGWQIAPPKAPPRIFFEVGGNLLRRTRGYDRLQETLLPKLDLLVTFDWRMSHTALLSDYVFPAAGWYERDDITWATPIAPFAHATTAATPPLAESKTDWVFHCLFLKELQRRAKERGHVRFTDRAGKTRRLDEVYDRFTFGGRYTEENTEEFLDALLELTTNLGGIGWKELKEKGFARYTELGFDFVNIGNATDIVPDQTITANTWHTGKKVPWPTLTRRAQFYIDHPFYLELGEELPVHKEPPRIGGDHPLLLTGQHARWSIHASWRDDAHLLRLQRGQPLILLSRRDARARGLADGDFARVRNDIGAFEVQVKVSDALRPGQVIINHAWEPFQFRGHGGHQALIPSPINPISLAGGYFHLQPTPLYGEAGANDRGTRVEVERLAAG